MRVTFLCLGWTVVHSADLIAKSSNMIKRAEAQWAPVCKRLDNLDD